MTTQAPSRLTEALLETADGMHRIGLIDAATHKKITLRHIGAQTAPASIPLSSEDIQNLRERAKMSQAAFARCLNLTAGYVSQLERGIKRPSGAALALLDVIRRKGIDAVL